MKATNLKDFFSKFEFILKCGSDPAIKEGKPAPDAFLVASQRFKKQPQNPSDCLAFEDSPNGVASARSAGMQCVMIPDSRVREKI